jgi:dTMP kinase
MFVVFEGIDGTGKSTQTRLLSEALIQKNIPHILTREPGGCTSAEHIRNLVLANEFLSTTELLLMIAARNEHWHHTIQPALRRGEWVVCDRYIDSTRAHQGFEAGIDLGLINQLHDLLHIPTKPDHVFILMLDIDTALSRARSRKQQDRYDHFDRSYYEKIYNGFQQLAKTEKYYHLIDANCDPLEVHKKVSSIVFS